MDEIEMAKLVAVGAISIICIISTYLICKREEKRTDKLSWEAEESFRKCIEDVRELCPVETAEWEQERREKS